MKVLDFIQLKNKSLPLQKIGMANKILILKHV